MNDRTTVDRGGIQEAQYAFPYHHLPHFDANGNPRTSRRLSWGLEYLLYQQHALERAMAMAPSSVLEVGCGDGYWIGNIPESVPRRIGVDLSARAVAFARLFAPTVEFVACGVEQIEETFDVVAAIEVFEHIPENIQAQFIAAVGRRVRPGGVFILSVPSIARPTHRKHYRHYDRETILREIALLGSDFKLETLEYVFVEPAWLKLLQRVLVNRIWEIEVKFLNRLIWRALWTKYRIGQTAMSGCHVFAVARRLSKDEDSATRVLGRETGK
jgi:SAM-dependent methyltransferase